LPNALHLGTVRFLRLPTPGTLKGRAPCRPGGGAMLTIYVDADACPVKSEVYRVAGRYQMPVKVVANVPLREPGGERVELVVCPGFGAADDWIAEQASAGDIVITADI